MMKLKRKLFIWLLVVFNIYFFSFFFWYKHVSFTYFFEEEESAIAYKLSPVSIFVPRVEFGKNESAGSISRSISFFYSPLSWYWEKRGIGVFYFDHITALKDFGFVEENATWK